MLHSEPSKWTNETKWIFVGTTTYMTCNFRLLEHKSRDCWCDQTSSGNSYILFSRSWSLLRNAVFINSICVFDEHARTVFLGDCRVFPQPDGEVTSTLLAGFPTRYAGPRGPRRLVAWITTQNYTSDTWENSFQNLLISRFGIRFGK